MSDSDYWVASIDKKCAVFITNASVAVIADQGAGMGFTWARIGEVVVYSCYCTPNCTVQEFDLFLAVLENSIVYQPGAPANLVIAGDFNAHSSEWSSATMDRRGTMLTDLATSLGLAVCNVGSRPTYRRVNDASVIDVTLERAFPHRRLVSDWLVLEEIYYASDHLYIAFNMLTQTTHTSSHGSIGVRSPG